MSENEESGNGPEAKGWTKERELEIAYSGPAVFANRFWVMFDSKTARLSFMERSATDKEQHYRTAVVMSRSDLESLRDLLVELLPQAQAQKSEGDDG